MEGRCKKCHRLIYDTEKLDELPNVIECQHCHHVNVIPRSIRGLKPKRRGKAEKPKGPKRLPKVVEELQEEVPEEELLPEPEDLSQAASPAFQGAMRDESAGPAIEEAPPVKEGDER